MTLEPPPDDVVAVLRFAAHMEGAAYDTVADAARHAFGITATRYYQRLHRALEHPAAESVEPATVRRLRAIAARRQQRTTRTGDRRP